MPMRFPDLLHASFHGGSMHKSLRPPDWGVTSRQIQAGCKGIFLHMLHAVHKDEIDDFHDHLNEQNVDIQLKKMENFFF